MGLEVHGHPVYGHLVGLTPHHALCHTLLPTLAYPSKLRRDKYTEMVGWTNGTYSL